MSDLSTQQRIINLICEQIVVGVSADEVNNESSLIDDLQLDSIQMIELITKLEGEFDIELDDEDMDFQFFSTINSLSGFVESKLS
jgi:acyl carrier protein